MNLLLVQPSEVAGAEVVVAGRRAAHVRSVLRAKPGDRIRVGVVRESVGTAEVVHSGDDELVLGNAEFESAGPAPSLRLIIALPRPKALRRLLQTAASFGVAHIDIVNAWRVSKSYWSSPSIESIALENELWLGCEQGRHVWLPSIATHRLLMPFIEGLSKNDRETRLVAHPGAAKWLRDVRPSSSPATLAIGPEGGWIDAELASLDEVGFEKISVSKAILRSEIALAAALAQWELLRG